MKKLMLVAVLAVSSAVLPACSYGGVSTDGNRVVVLKNNMFLFGLLRAAYVCKVTEGGLTDCKSSDAP